MSIQVTDKRVFTVTDKRVFTVGAGAPTTPTPPPPTPTPTPPAKPFPTAMLVMPASIVAGITLLIIGRKERLILE